MSRLWLIGGTKESAELAQAIAQQSLECIVTVTTATAVSLYPDSPCLRVWVGLLGPDQVDTFVQSHQITAILDASHPYAIAISQLAIAVAARQDLPYLRYERPTLTPLESAVASSGQHSASFPDFDSLLASGILRNQRVLLTVGYRPLAQFQAWQNQATLFARILPSQTALQAALAAGFTPDRLIALRPPVAASLEQALWQQWQISMVITKASGQPGGEDIKRAVATELGVTLVTIRRPVVAYPRQTSHLEQAIAFCLQSGDRPARFYP